MRNDAEGNEIGWEVVTAVADAKGVDPLELEPPLATVVDPEALGRLFETTNENEGYVRFRYSGCEVTIHSDGRVRIRDPVPVE